MEMSNPEKIRKNILSLSSAELVQMVVQVKRNIKAGNTIHAVVSVRFAVSGGF